METRPKPLIGITPSAVAYQADHGDFRRYASMMDYPDAVLAAGGMPVILPFQSGDARALLERLDGLVLSGGSDLDPARYGDATVHPDTYDVDPDRDAFELAMVEAALALDRPILAICRGIQVLNVALGGTLHQHLPDVAIGIAHRQHRNATPIPGDRPGHEVTVSPASTLARLVGVDRLPVNSFHHQAVKVLAPDLVAVAISDDGVVEAVEHRFRPDVIGVQWHPELMARTSERQAALFANLVRDATTATLVV